jgi:hypothetical protein
MMRSMFVQCDNETTRDTNAGAVQMHKLRFRVRPHHLF